MGAKESDHGRSLRFSARLIQHLGFGKGATAARWTGSETEAEYRCSRVNAHSDTNRHFMLMDSEGGCGVSECLPRLDSGS